MRMRDVTPPQTVGPFFHGLIEKEGSVIASERTQGERIRIRGRVLDGSGGPVDDAMVEVWQANAHGRYRHPADQRQAPLDESFIGFGRAGTVDGEFVLETIRPGPVPSPEGGWQAPHLNVLVFARGLLDRLATRIYFEDDPSLGTDVVLASVPEDRRATLLARREQDGGPADYRFDVVLQGERETVFFDL
jgi:protocatechuate 3,4-dioxygenase alpha subunit